MKYLTELLDKETQAYSVYLDLAVQKKQALIDNDLEAIEGITAEEKDLSTKVLALEAARGEFLREQGFPASISIHDILPKFSGKEREELESSAERLKDVLTECKKFSASNMALLKQSSNYINHMIRIFTQNVPGAGKPRATYSNKGVESFQSGKIADMQG